MVQVQVSRPPNPSFLSDSFANYEDGCASKHGNRRRPGAHGDQTLLVVVVVVVVVSVSGSTVDPVVSVTQ